MSDNASAHAQVRALLLRKRTEAIETSNEFCKKKKKTKFNNMGVDVNTNGCLNCSLQTLAFVSPVHAVQD